MYEDFDRAPHTKLIGSLSGHKDSVTGLAWSPNGEWLASTSVDGVLNLWSRIGYESQPRFMRKSSVRPTPGLTSVAWSPDGQFLACGSTAGSLEIWETGGFRAIPHEDSGARSAISCVTWARGPHPDDLRVAFGGDDRTVHFRNFRDWDKPDTERGIGHAYTIRAMAWAPDGTTVVTGTSGGTIGVWRPSQLTNELGTVLSWRGTSAHDDAVSTLAFCTTTGVLASGGCDGRVHLWNLAEGLIVDEFTIEEEEEVVDLAFAHNGEVLVVQALHHIRFLRRDPLRQIAAFNHRACIDPMCRIAVSPASRVATVSAADPAAIAVRHVDFHAWVRQSELSRRPYRAAAVSLLGAPESGRTNLVLGITSRPFVAERSEHPFQVHRLPVGDAPAVDSAAEVREIALWDLPTRIDHALVHRMHAGDGAVALMVLSAQPGTRAASDENIERWHRTLQRWRTISRRAAQQLIVAVTKCDEFERAPVQADALYIAQRLDVHSVMFTSAKTGKGIAELRRALIDAVAWETTTGFPSLDVLELLAAFVAEWRNQGRHLTSVRDMYEAFKYAHPYALQHVSAEEVFREGVQLLEVLGHLELFAERDEIVLDPRYYHTYASAMIAGAERDPHGAGRLPLKQAERGHGPQMLIPESERLADLKQEARLLALTINELIVCDVAQRVGADDGSHLVFPMSINKVRDASDVRPPRVAHLTFKGPTDSIYSSLVVRLLGQPRHYPNPELWRNEAFFSTATGGKCGFVLAPNEAGDEGAMSICSEPQTSDVERQKFVDIVCGHVDERGIVVAREEEPAVASAAVTLLPEAGEPMEVYLCWRGLKAGAATAMHVRTIAEQLRARGMAITGDVPEAETVQEHLERIERAVVVAVLVSGSLSRRQEREVHHLDAAGCRLIPVILPNAPKTFQLPAILERWGHVQDFRRDILGIDALAGAIRLAHAKGRVRPTTGHVFVSYSRTDHAHVERLVQQLEESGHNVWWDRGHAQPGPGTDWQDAIQTAIRDSYAFVWCVSHAALYKQKSWIYPELDTAIEVQRLRPPGRAFIILVRLSDCEPPDMKITSGTSLHKTQWFDYFEPSRSIGELARELDKLRRQVRGPEPESV